MITKIGESILKEHRKRAQDQAATDVVMPKMLTKTGAALYRHQTPNRFEKTANPLLTVPALHLAQNIAAKNQLSRPDLHKKLLQAFLSKTTTGNKMFGAKGAVLPELALGEKEFVHAGKRFEEALKSQNIEMDQLSNRDIVTIKRLLRGDITQAMKGQSPNRKAMFEAVMHAMSKQTGGVSEMLLQKGQKPLQELEELWKTNPVSNNLLKGVSDQIGKVKDFSPSTSKERFARGATMAGVTGAIAAVDPATAVVNVGKHALGADWLRKFRPAAYIQDKMQQIFVKKPMEKAFNEGVKGHKVTHGGLDNFFMDYAMNPIINQTNNLVRGVGRIAHNQGITLDHIADAKRNLPKAMEHVKNRGMYKDMAMQHKDDLVQMGKQAPDMLKQEISKNLHIYAPTQAAELGKYLQV